jgi:DnaJ-class molecular chaperone
MDAERASNPDVECRVVPLVRAVCERCDGTGEVEGQMPNRINPEYLDDVPLVCSDCEGSGVTTEAA